MPQVNRDDQLLGLCKENFLAQDWYGKAAQAATTLVTTLFFIVTQKLKVALGFEPDRANLGRLTTVIPGRIYQQTSFGGNTQCTVLMNRKKDGLLIYIPARITKEFRQDIENLNAKVQFIVAHNEFHETFADDAKKAWPDAEVLTPKGGEDAVGEAVAIDATLEDRWEVLEKDFGFIKMFRFDENSRCKTERSYLLDLFDDDDNSKQKQCLFVAQCGMGHYKKFYPHVWLTGFQQLLNPRGRCFRHYYVSFVVDKDAMHPYWVNMVTSSDNLHAAIFTHGDSILGTDTKRQLLGFYSFGDCCSKAKKL